MDREDHHPVGARVVLVHEQHPSPRPDQEPQPAPSSVELGTQARELAQWLQAGTHARSGIRRQRQPSDEPVQILHGSTGELDLRHALQLVESDRVTGRGLTTAKLGPLPRTIDPVEDRDDGVRVGVLVVDG